MGKTGGSRLTSCNFQEEKLNIFKRNKYSEFVKKYHIQIPILHIRIANSIVYEIKCTFVP